MKTFFKLFINKVITFYQSTKTYMITLHLLFLHMNKAIEINSYSLKEQKIIFHDKN